MYNIVFFADSSFSVNSYIQPLVKALNSFIETQRKVGPENRLTLVKYNETLEYIFLYKIISSIDTPLLTQDINPTGGVAFYDNVTTALARLCTFSGEMKTHVPTIAIVFTDKWDTCSRRITPELMLLQIARLQLRGWKFIFLGTTDIAVNIGRKLGYNVCIKYDISEKGLSDSMDVITQIIEGGARQNVDIDLTRERDG